MIGFKFRNWIWYHSDDEQKSIKLCEQKYKEWIKNVLNGNFDEQFSHTYDNRDCLRKIESDLNQKKIFERHDSIYEHRYLLGGNHPCSIFLRSNWTDCVNPQIQMFVHKLTFIDTFLIWFNEKK